MSKRPLTNRIQTIFYSEISHDRRKIFEDKITDVPTFLICLYAHCKQRPTEREISRIRKEYRDVSLSIGMRGLVPTVLDVARTLNELEWDDALWYILPFVHKSEDQDALRMCMAERRRRCKSIIASPGSPGHSTKYLGEVGQKASPPEVEPNAPPWTESATLTSTGFIRPQESTLASKTRAAFGVLREILLALDGHNTSASEPLIFPKRLLTPCLQSATGVNNRAEVDGKQLYRRTFICSPDKDEITQSALTEIQVLLRFRDPGLPILLGYTYAEDPDNPGTIRLELFTQWHEMRSIASWIQSTQPVEWNINARIQVLYKLAKTLDFLLTNQSAYVFHQNLCTRTVVLQSQCHPILVDFTKALIINKETDKTVSIQEANQSGAILCGQRKDVMGFAKVCLEVWSHKLWEDTQHNDDLTDMIKEEKLTLIKQILDDKKASTDHSKSNCSKECSVHERMGQLISLLLCEDVYSEMGLMTKVTTILQNILTDCGEAWDLMT